MLGRRTYGLSLVLAAALVAGCATTPLPNPKTQDGSLLVGRLYIRRVRKDGTSDLLIHSARVSNYPHGVYYYFTDLPPGTYQVDHYVRPEAGSIPELLFTFAPPVVDGTRIEVPARSVVYMGDFTVRYKQTLVPHTYQVVETSGGKSDREKALALDFLKKRYGSSPWATYAYAR